MNISQSETRKGAVSSKSWLPEAGHYQAALLPFFPFCPMNLKIFSTGQPSFGKRAVFLSKWPLQMLLQGDYTGALAFSGHGGGCIQCFPFLCELSKHQQSVCWRQAKETCHFDYVTSRPNLGTLCYCSKFLRDVEEKRCNLESLLGLGPGWGTVARAVLSEELLEMPWAHLNKKKRIQFGHSQH